MSADCSVCENASLLQNAACNEKEFRWHVLKTLCYIVAYLTDPPTADSLAITLPLKTIEFGDIGTSYSDTEFLDDEKSVKFFRAINNTDADIFLSDSDANDKWFIPANTTKEIDFGSMGQTLVVNENLFIKRDNSISMGNFYLEGSY